MAIYVNGKKVAGRGISIGGGSGEGSSGSIQNLKKLIFKNAAGDVLTSYDGTADRQITIPEGLKTLTINNLNGTKVEYDGSSAESITLALSKLKFENVAIGSDSEYDGAQTKTIKFPTTLANPESLIVKIAGQEDIIYNGNEEKEISIDIPDVKNQIQDFIEKDEDKIVENKILDIAVFNDKNSIRLLKGESVNGAFYLCLESDPEIKFFNSTELRKYQIENKIRYLGFEQDYNFFTLEYKDGKFISYTNISMGIGYYEIKLILNDVYDENGNPIGFKQLVTASLPTLAFQLAFSINEENQIDYFAIDTVSGDEPFKVNYDIILSLILLSGKRDIINMNTGDLYYSNSANDDNYLFINYNIENSTLNILNARNNIHTSQHIGGGNSNVEFITWEDGDEV